MFAWTTFSYTYDLNMCICEFFFLATTKPCSHCKILSERGGKKPRKNFAMLTQLRVRNAINLCLKTKPNWKVTALFIVEERKEWTAECSQMRKHTTLCIDLHTCLYATTVTATNRVQRQTEQKLEKESDGKGENRVSEFF